MRNKTKRPLFQLEIFVHVKDFKKFDPLYKNVLYFEMSTNIFYIQSLRLSNDLSIF